MTYNGDAQGAVWRKWDLHIHTPASYEQNYGDSQDQAVWNRFFDSLRNLPPEIEVVGINDYYSITGYNLVREQWLAGNLPNLRCVLPVVELRLDHLAGNAETQRLNLHVVFSDEVESRVIEGSFLPMLRVRTDFYEGGIGDAIGMAAFGAALKASVRPERRPTVSDVKAGFQHSFVAMQQVRDALSQTAFHSRFLLGLGYTEWDGMRFGGGGGVVKRSIASEVDFFLGASTDLAVHKKRVAYLHGEGLLHALLNGTDAHRFADDPATDRRVGDPYTWLRADPTFHGLRRALTKYDERVFVGVEPAQRTSSRTQKYRYISRISVRKNTGSKLGEAWFDLEIPINPGLVAIIGNQGGGKSALTDCLALLANANATHFSFLNQQRFRKLPENRAAEFTGTLDWLDNTTEKRLLTDNPDPGKPERARYIPQQFFDLATNELRADTGGTFYSEIEKAVFSHIPAEQREGCISFRALVEKRSQAISDDLLRLRTQMASVCERICQLEEDTGVASRQAVEVRLKERQRQIAEVSAAKPNEVPEPPREQRDEEADKIREEIGQLEAVLREEQRTAGDMFARRQALSRLRSGIESARAEALRLRDEAIAQAAPHGDEFEAEGLLKVDVDVSLVGKEIDRCDGLVAAARKAQDEDIDGSAAHRLAERRFSLEKRTEAASVAQKAFESFRTELAAWETQLRGLRVGGEDPEAEETLVRLATRMIKEIPGELTKLRAERRELAAEIHQALCRQRDIYSELASFAQAFLEEEPLTRDRYRLEFDLALVPTDLVDRFFGLIKHQGPFEGADASKAWFRGELERWNFDNGQAAVGFAAAMEDRILSGKTSDELRWGACATLLKKGQSAPVLWRLLYGLEFLQPRYRLRLAGKALEALSPGERGIVLLIFYLIVDKSLLPLIIDQPEGNLNNQSIFEHLVPVISRAKEKRQVIMVSHNPNIVVGCDADQVIHAELLPENLQLRYTAGALESPHFRETTIDKLEGTRPAFETRSLAYEE